ncbi:MAG: DUF3109 family protein [Bacteroidales bacterium]|nr:DUF3109 family protein [Bacteroidales bacterium]
MIQIGDILVSEDVVKEYFACDYPVCRGACCIVGDAGAPLNESELPALERDFPKYSPSMLETGREAVKLNGFFEIDPEGDMVTPLVSGSSACAFAHFAPDGCCMCAIEKEGCRKPVSCSLYPVRVKKFRTGSLGLNLHKWDICKCAFEKGRREGIRAYQFLRKPLTDAFGEEFYEALCAAAEHVLNG